jgi:Holliday junction DNA helicase RuvA
VIARLEGILRDQTPTRVVLDVGGVGYEVHVPLSTFTELPDPGKLVALEIHTHVSEGAIQLYGFHTRAEKAAFELLLRANRVGPKLAQTILSGISPLELVGAIRAGDVASLRAVPGIGTKMAERILVELRDRVGDLALAAGLPGAARPAPTPEDSARDQTLSALLNLGYSQAEAERVLAEAEQEAGSDATLETLVRAALKRMVR